MAADLNTPVVPASTDVLGIHQSDLIIRSALVLAFADLRKQPWLLDYAFASLPRDPETAAEYGEAEVAKAKEWFLKTNIAVRMNVHTSDVKFPCVSIALVNSVEQEQEGTLGDTHYVPFEDTDGTDAYHAGPFVPVSYDAATGAIELDEAEAGDFDPQVGMIVVDRAGGRHEILSVEDALTFSIAPNSAPDLEDFVVHVAQPALAVEVESTVYRETYAIGCHVDSEPVHLTYLHSVVKFALLRYKQALLEARGFERSTLSSTDFRREDVDLPEFFYTRYIQVAGTVRQAWPKTALGRITSVPTTVLAGAFGDDGVAVASDSTAASASAFATQRVYWGAAAQPGSVNEAFVLALSNLADVPARQMGYGFEADPNEYLWWALPASFGGAATNFVDPDSGLDVGVALVAQVAVDGTPYNVFRSNQHSLGAVLVKVE